MKRKRSIATTSTNNTKSKSTSNAIKQIYITDSDSEGGAPTDHANVPKDRPVDYRQQKSKAKKKTTKRSTNNAFGRVSSFFAPQIGGSNRSITELNIFTSDEASLRTLVTKLPERLPNEKESLRNRYESMFGRWWSQWRAGHSLLFYGLGSKSALLSKFARSCAQDGACIAINGLEPSITAKQIVVRCAALIKLSKHQRYRNHPAHELLDMISSEHPHRRLYAIIHNIDGPGLRDTGSQQLLSQLAALPNVHIAASIDHLNAPLLWDLQTKDRFAWLWQHTTTFEPYLDEVIAAAVPSLLLWKGEACTKQSALVVLSSLSHTAREVFRHIVDAQLDPGGDGGISFQRLFTTCRERFLVSNEMLLKTFLVEFRDHDLLQTK